MIPCLTCGAPCYPSGRCADPTHEGGPSQPGYPSEANRRDKALSLPSGLPALDPVPLVRVLMRGLDEPGLHAVALVLLEAPGGETAMRAALLKAARKGQGR